MLHSRSQRAKAERGKSGWHTDAVARRGIRTLTYDDVQEAAQKKVKKETERHVGIRDIKQQSDKH